LDMTHSSPVYLRVQPESIVSFDYIPRKYLTSIIRLSNPTTHFIAYKVKTTVPTSYLVKPHMGYLSPNNSVEITITMQPTDYDAQAAAAISDKFLVSAFPLNSEMNSSILADPVKFNKLWTETSKSIIQNHKLTVHLNLEHKRLSPKTPGKPGFTYNGFETSESPKTPVSKPKETSQGALGSTTDFESTASIKSPTGYNTPKWFNISWSRESTRDTLSGGSESSLQMSKSQSLENSTKSDKQLKENNFNEICMISSERVKVLEQKVNDLIEDNKRQEKMNQMLIETNKQQEKLQKELKTEKEKLTNDLKSIKNKLFKEANGTINHLEFLANGKYQLWHILCIIILSFLIGIILAP